MGWRGVLTIVTFVIKQFVRLSIFQYRTDCIDCDGSFGVDLCFNGTPTTNECELYHAPVKSVVAHQQQMFVWLLVCHDSDVSLHIVNVH